MKHHFFALLSRMKYIFRWPLMRNTRSENICEHSYEVAVVAHALALLHNKRYGGTVNVERCVLLAMYHDTTEILTGDLPTPVKYDNPAILQAYRSVEQAAADRLIEQLPADLQDEYRTLLWQADADEQERCIVKAADKISALIKCIEEVKQGNNEFKQARKSVERAVRAMNLPAADCFLDECIPSFALTLDEQQ